MMNRYSCDPVARRGQTGPLVLGALCFGLLLAGAGLLVLKPSAAPEVPVAVAIERSAVHQPVAEAATVESDGQRVEIAAVEETVAEPFSVDSVSPGEQVDAYLAAGEFGAAADVAAELTGITREELMSRVVHAQIQAGDVDAAHAILPQFGGNGQRQARSDVARQRMLAGGMGADFDTLIELIQEQTSGPWFETDGVGGTIDSFESGVRVDPNGVLSREIRQDATGQLAAVGARARVAALNNDMAQPATLRLVSLTRLEREVARRMAAGQPVVESMKQLAGLSQIQYVFVYPDENEIVLGGPAEGWQYNELGMALGVSSGRPTLHLDDLVTVLRTFSDGGVQMFGCSIDPKPENIKAVQEFAAESQARGALSPAGVKTWANRIGNLLGMQDITVYGVPADSRVARVLVEADYRMKLIGIGRLKAGSSIPDYFTLLAKEPSLASGGLDALRWWMTMKYDAVLHSADQNSFEIRGSAVLCRSENQFLTDGGERVNTGKAEPINQLFAANFTQHYQQLAQQDPIFAELQGIFDLALVAALIHRDQLDQKAGWDRGVFAADGAYRPAGYPVPKQVESVVNHRVFNGKDVVLQVAGGVRGDLAAVLSDSEIRQSSPRLDGVAEKAKASNLPAGRWWWDAR